MLKTPKTNFSLMKNLLCPQCKIRRFFLKNEAGDRLTVTVDENLTIRSIHENQSTERFQHTGTILSGLFVERNRSQFAIETRRIDKQKRLKKNLFRNTISN